jgi:hypothetical protein
MPNLNAWGMTPQEVAAKRAEIHAKPQPCYGGQWTVHEAHDYEVHVQNWLGGGQEIVHCPGKTAETILGPGAGGHTTS